MRRTEAQKILEYLDVQSMYIYQKLNVPKLYPGELNLCLLDMKYIKKDIGVLTLLQIILHHYGFWFHRINLFLQPTSTSGEKIGNYLSWLVNQVYLNQSSKEQAGIIKFLIIYVDVIIMESILKWKNLWNYPL